MSHSTLRDNDAVVLFGFPAREGLTVSNSIADLGLQMLRAKPSALNWICLPDIIQTRFAMFKACLPQFAWASWKGEPCSSKGGGFLVRWSEVEGKQIPFSRPSVVLSWIAPPPSETLETLRNELSVQETVSGGKTAFLYKPKDWSDYDAVKKYKVNIRATAPVETLAVKSVIASRAIIASITTLIFAIRYPAFADNDHETAFNIGKEVTPNSDGQMDVDGTEESRLERITVRAPGSFADLANQNIPSWVIDYTGLPDGNTFFDISKNADQIPQNDGLWFPYLDVLPLYDEKTVPQFIREVIPLSFGDDLDECFRTVNELVAEWGCIHKTEFGNEVSHLVTVIKISLAAQARPIPCFRHGRYAGCVLLGAGYTLELNERRYRPVSFTELRQAIEGSDTHTAALHEIAKLTGNKDQAKQVKECKTMLELRNVLISSWTKSKDSADLLRQAQSLNFGENQWPINITTISKALRSIRDQNFSLKIADAAEYPIHHSTVLSTDTVELVLSCFGALAPSFRIPGGKEFDLGDEMEFAVSNPGGTRKETRKLVRIAVRQKPLAQAVSDLKEVRDKKTIMNPIVAPRIRQSQQNMDKFFTGEEGKLLRAVLQEFAEISRGQKRKAGDVEGSSKKIRSALEDDGW